MVSLRRYIKVGQRRPPLNRKTILMRDHGLCQYCVKNADNIDHVIPRSKGGGTTWENCVASCRTCNSHKAAKYLKDMPHMKLRRQPGPPTALSWVHSAVWKVRLVYARISIYLSQAIFLLCGMRDCLSSKGAPCCTVPGTYIYLFISSSISIWISSIPIYLASFCSVYC